MAKPSATETEPTTGSRQLPLARPARTRWRWSPRLTRWLPWLPCVALGATLVDRAREPDCRSATKAASHSAFFICQREYQRTEDPGVGVWLAETLRQDRKLDEAEHLAQTLLPTRVRPQAFRILGGIALERGRFREAIAELDAALTLHRQAHDHLELALDEVLLANAYAEHDQFTEALRALDSCISAAREAGDAGRNAEYTCHRAAIKLLDSAGLFEQAAAELALAEPLASSDRERVELFYSRGLMEQESVRVPPYLAHPESAIYEFRRAIKLNADAQFQSLAIPLELSLTYTLAESGRTDDAERHLATARQLDLQASYRVAILRLKARIAYRRGQLALANALNEQAWADHGDDGDDDGEADERLFVAEMQADIALSQQDFASAERWAQAGITEVERLRRAQPVLELRSWVLSTRREPYEQRFVALVGERRLEDALMMIDQWQGRSMIDAMTRTRLGLATDLNTTAGQFDRLDTWMTRISSAPFAQPVERAAVHAALQTFDLLALVVARDHVWRLSANHGAFAIDDLGPRHALDAEIDEMREQPNDAAVAGELGARLVPDELIRSTREPLHVLLDGRIASWPIAALQVHGHLVIAQRPIVRVLRIPELPCITATRSGRGSVLADPTSNLAGARREGTAVAARLHTTAVIGEAATARALFATAGSSVLHLASHTDISATGTVLKLADRDVSAAEISASQLGPSLVVLMSCSSALSQDTELAGSLATAFLAAGSDQVVASTRGIDDAKTASFAARFYDVGGVDDAVAALTHVQLELAERGDTEWPNFAVFGHDVCRPAR